MNTLSEHSPSLVQWVNTLWGRRDLLYQLVKRDVAGRYRGSALGLLWTILNPLFLLTVYTFVFTVVFKARWGALPLSSTQDTGMFAVILFSGLMLHMLMAECLVRAPSIILQNENFVKKVIFPLELFPVMVLLSSLFHQAMYVLILLGSVFAITGHIQPTIFYLPLLWMPFWLLLLGLTYIVASLGVFLRDIGQIMQLFITVLLFVSPVFYPIESLPLQFQHWMLLNPLTFVIEQTRDVLLWGREPQWNLLAVFTGVSLLILMLGVFWFQRTRKGFADVL
jgi:lipopolysaccharide transport system permease protein